MTKINIPRTVPSDGTFEYMGDFYPNTTSLLKLALKTDKFDPYKDGLGENYFNSTCKKGYLTTRIENIDFMMNPQNNRLIMNKIEYNEAIIFGFRLGINGDTSSFLFYEEEINRLRKNIIDEIYDELYEGNSSVRFSPISGRNANSFRSIHDLVINETLDLIFEGVAFSQLLGMLYEYLEKGPEWILAEIEKKPEFTVRQVALMCFYLMEAGVSTLTANNAKSIAAKYGFTSPTSGKYLYQEFSEFKREDNRISIAPGNRNSANTQMDLFDKILPELKKQNPKACELAEVDQKKAKNNYDNHY